jgi:hypothetical protein
MAIVNINVGSAPNDNTGDLLRDAFIKCNSNFSFLNGGTNQTFEEVLANGNDASTSSFIIGSMFIKDDTLAGVGVVEFSNGRVQFRDQNGEQTLSVGWLGFELGSQLVAPDSASYMFTSRRFLVNNSSMTENLGITGNAKITDRLSIGASGSTDFKLEVSEDDASQYQSSSATLSTPVGVNSIALNLKNTNTGNLKPSYIQFSSKNPSSQNQYSYIGGIGSSSSYANSMVFGFRTGATAYNEFMRISSSGMIIGGTAVTNGVVFQIDSTTKGVLLPRMTTTQINALNTNIGMIVYNTTLNHLCIYDGSGWKKFSMSNM